MYFFIFNLFRIDVPGRKQCRPRSDAAYSLAFDKNWEARHIFGLISSLTYGLEKYFLVIFCHFNLRTCFILNVWLSNNYFEVFTFFCV